MRQTPVAKGDFHISRRSTHPDLNLTKSDVKVTMKICSGSPARSVRNSHPMPFFTPDSGHTGMRIGECADLPYDCLHNVGPDRWAIHVPLGKLKTERMVPIDSFVCQIVHRLRFFRSFDPLPIDGRLLARPRHKQTLVKQLRSYLPDVVAAVGIPTRIVPHQLRHTYASEMVRAGVGLPALMKLLGHVNPEMTMRYVDVA